MPVYLFRITLKTKTITGLRQYDTHDIDLVFRQAKDKAEKAYGRDLVEIDVFMVHRQSKYYYRWVAGQGRKGE